MQPYVRSFAISGNDAAGSYKVLPDTGIVMGFQYTGHLSYQHNEAVMPLSTAGITGLQDKFKVFINSKNTNTVLVIFSETGAAACFKQPMHELFGQSLALSDLLLQSQMDVVSEQIGEAGTDEERIKAVEDFLLSCLSNKENDELVTLAVTLIKQAKGNIRITTLTEKLHISQSRLEKRFRKIVGASPKKFASIVRLKNILAVPARANQLIDLALEAGYFDQSHFIKDFKTFTGQTPEQFFKKD